jgi:hypothetical protein
LSLSIFVEHTKLQQLNDIALEIAKKCTTHLKIEINFNKEKTKAVANIMLFDVSQVEEEEG